MLIVGENESFSDCSVLTLSQVKKMFYNEKVYVVPVNGCRSVI